MYIDLHASCPLLLSYFNETQFSRQIFEQSTNIKFQEIPYSGSRFCPRRQTEGYTGMMKLTVAFRNFANPPKRRETIQIIIRLYD
jgi:hypothetical protein